MIIFDSFCLMVHYIQPQHPMAISPQKRPCHMLSHLIFSCKKHVLFWDFLAALPIHFLDFLASHLHNVRFSNRFWCPKHPVLVSEKLPHPTWSLKVSSVAHHLGLVGEVAGPVIFWAQRLSSVVFGTAILLVWRLGVCLRHGLPGESTHGIPLVYPWYTYGISIMFVIRGKMMILE